MATQTPAIEKEIVKKVAKAAGWMQFKAKKEIAAAQQLGISPKQYLKKHCWQLNQEELESLGARLERQRQIREEQAAELSEVTGWSVQESARRIREAKGSGLTFKQYINRRGYEISHDDLPRLATVLKANKRYQEDKHLYMLDMIVERSGWTRSYVEKSLEAASEKGINIFNYFANSCWVMDDAQLDACGKLCTKLQENLQSKRDKCREYISEQTGWTEGETILKTLEAAADSGCSVEDYARCRMWELDKDEQRTFLNSSIFRKFRIDNNDFQIGSPIFDYKDTFEDVFSDLISRRHFSFDGMSKGDFFDNIKGLSYIVVKPARGSYGREIEILPCNESYLQNGDLYQRLLDLGKPLVIEEKIEQCDVLNELCPTSVNTLRVVTLLRDEGTHVLQCVLRCGVGAVVDNIHSGGLVVEVDPQTGVCKGDAVDYYGNLVKTHPVTGVPFKGLQIPNIGDVVTLAEEAAKVVPECKLIGWDIAVTQSGADLVEGNLKADYDAGQMAHLGVAREGLRQAMVAPYVNPSILGHSYIDELVQEAEDAASLESAKFKFSVVIPIYKAEAYLHEAVGSVINQTIGFEENIQVILVNDGSPDDSASICKEYVDQYPDNIVFVDKENGGPSSARNAGIPYAEGAFINFLDSDDKWAKDAFENVWNLIDKYKGEIDVVGCRLKYFEEKTGYHPLDYKFKDGDRVVDIKKNPDFVQMSLASAFIASGAFKGRSFDERIISGEDAKFLTEVVLEKGRYGLVKNAVYHYRKSDANTSLTQTKDENKSAFIDTIKHYYSFIADYSVEKFGRIVPYVEHCLVNGLKYRVGKPLPEVLDELEADEYRRMATDLIGRISDGVLLEARNATPSLKLYMLHLKNGMPIKEIPHIDDGGVWVNGGLAFKITGNGDVRFDDLEFSEDTYTIHGSARIPGFVDAFGVFSEIGGDVNEVGLSEEGVEEKIGITDETISARRPFTIEFSVRNSSFEVRIYVNYDDDVICAPISVAKEGGFPRVDKGSVSAGDYLVSRPDKYVVSFEKK